MPRIIDDRTFASMWNACGCVAQFVALTDYTSKGAASCRALRLRQQGMNVKAMPFQQVKSIADRFWLKVKRTRGCWIWTGSVNAKGYGQMSQGRRGLRPLQTHRVSWQLHYGQIPDGLLVLHSCDNPRCVRPDHLFLGTAADNTADMVAKERGRWQRNAPHKHKEVANANHT